MKDKVRDDYERPIISLRISITNRCNVNCIYCHHDGMLDSSSEMTPDEIYEICRIAKKLGVEKIRLSGGEPLVRPDIVEIIEKVNSLDFKDISITTNGIFLDKYAKDLFDAGLDRVNVSLDTLNEETYKMIVGKNVLQRVKDGIVESCAVGLYPVKINMVVMNNINNDEIMDMFEFTKHYPLAEFEKYLAEIADDIRVRPFMQDRKKYFIDGGEIEVVHPVDNTNFCKNCTRLRITPEGKIKPCIEYIREGVSDEELVDIFLKGIHNREPYYKEENN